MPPDASLRPGFFVLNSLLLAADFLLLAGIFAAAFPQLVGTMG